MDNWVEQVDNPKGDRYINMNSGKNKLDNKIVKNLVRNKIAAENVKKKLTTMRVKYKSTEKKNKWAKEKSNSNTNIKKNPIINERSKHGADCTCQSWVYCIG